MPKTKREAALYRRGPYRLDWDVGRGGARRPFLTVFWYDSERRKVRRASTGTAELEAAKQWLDAFYLERSTGQATCPTCGQPRHRTSGYLVTSAIATYQTIHADRLPSAGAIAARLAHVVDYLEASDQVGATCERIDDAWVQRFRSWVEGQPIVSPRGGERQRSLSTVEGSVAQLSAAINHAYRRGDTRGPARFKTIPIRSLNRTPEYRCDAAELAAMFRYCVAPKVKGEEERKRRIRERAGLWRYLLLSVATLGRPDAVLDVNTEPKRRQWNSKAKVLALNPAGRRQTSKYRATVPVAWKVAQHLDAAERERLADLDAAKREGRAPKLTGFFVGPKSVRKAWETMCAELGLPGEGAAGSKLIRRSVADLVRQRLPAEAWTELEIFLGHRRFDTVSDLYAPFNPNYLRRALAGIEGLIDEIERLAPGAFHPTCTPRAAAVVPMRQPANA